MAHGKELTLGDFGERRLISELLAQRYSKVAEFGDDCALLPHAELTATDALLVTTDPCPEPAAHIAGFADEYYRGWLLATINLSDLAAAGAKPMGLVTSLVLPSTMQLGDFERLLDGLDECCARAGTSVVGGNLKEGPKIDVSATAVGLCHGPAMSRKGARPGHEVAVVGDLGFFWAGLASIRAGHEIPPGFRDALMRNILTPVAKVAAGQVLRALGVVSSAMDNSDGLYASLDTFRITNGLGAHLDFTGVTWDPAVEWAAGVLGVEPLRFALGWGDWQLVITYEPAEANKIRDALRPLDVTMTAIGKVADNSRITIRAGKQIGALSPIDSQRFTSDSWFSAGLTAYEDLLLRGPIIQA